MRHPGSVGNARSFDNGSYIWHWEYHQPRRDGRPPCPVIDRMGYHCSWWLGHPGLISEARGALEHSITGPQEFCAICIKDLYKRNRTPIVNQPKEEPRTHPYVATENPSATS